MWGALEKRTGVPSRLKRRGGQGDGRKPQKERKKKSSFFIHTCGKKEKKKGSDEYRRLRGKYERGFEKKLPHQSGVQQQQMVGNMKVGA